MPSARAAARTSFDRERLCGAPARPSTFGGRATRGLHSSRPTDTVIGKPRRRDPGRPRRLRIRLQSVELFLGAGADRRLERYCHTHAPIWHSADARPERLRRLDIRCCRRSARIADEKHGSHAQPSQGTCRQGSNGCANRDRAPRWTSRWRRRRRICGARRDVDRMDGTVQCGRRQTRRC